MTSNAVKPAPSILAADFAYRGDQVADHQLAEKSEHLPLEAHLMISNPDFFVDEFVQAGTDSFLVHWEGNNNLSRTVQSIKALGKRVGVAINPATCATVLE